MTQLWSATHANAHITGTGTTSIATNASNIYVGVFGTETFAIGKFYWETTGTGPAFTTGNARAGVGIGNSGTGTGNGTFLGFVTDSIGFFCDGTIQNNDATYVDLGLPFTTGQLVCHALDIAAGFYWVRLGTSGNWNGNASADPATNTTGAITIPAAVLASPVTPGANLYASTDTLTAAFAQSSWQGAAPAGFGPFDPSLSVWLFVI